MRNGNRENFRFYLILTHNLTSLLINGGESTILKFLKKLNGYQ